jgi:hypothetical protein
VGKLGDAEGKSREWTDSIPRFSSNEPFGSRPEPGAPLFAHTLRIPPSEVPEGRARDVQDTATRVQSESENSGPERETGVTKLSLFRVLNPAFPTSSGIAFHPS